MAFKRVKAAMLLCFLSCDVGIRAATIFEVGRIDGFGFCESPSIFLRRLSFAFRDY